MPIGQTNFPTSVDDNTSLVTATNQASTTLSGAHTNSVTTITVASTSLFPPSGIILIDSELISYTGKTSGTFTGCTRGFEGTTAASHSGSVTVAFVYTAKMHQALIDAMVAVQTKLGYGASGPTNGQALMGAVTGSSWRALVKADVGLANVDNTSDVNKPVSTATSTALAGKVDNTRTVAGHALSADVVITGADLSLSDVTTNNASTSMHGFLKKLSGNSAEFMNGAGNWVAPSGSGDMVLSSVQTVTGAKTFNDTKLLIAGGAYGASDTSLPAVVAKSFLLNTDSGRMFFGKVDGSAWAEIFQASISSPISVAAGGTGVSTLTGIPKFSGTSPVTVAKEVWAYALSDETTALTTGLKLTARAPHAFTITEVRTSVTTASSSGLVTLNVLKNGTTIFSTQVSIDASEKTSLTAATPAVLSTTSIADDDELTFNITAAGTGATGLKCRILGHQ